jgi:SAM-dependent methyltransferase/CelD/BcsL family acetyltransferase involved in cellulose biosynthesis
MHPSATTGAYFPQEDKAPESQLTLGTSRRAAGEARSGSRDREVAPGHLASDLASPCVVTVARSVEQVELLREAWTRLGSNRVRTDIDYFLWSLTEDRRVIRPHVVSVQRDGKTEAIVAARLSSVPLPCKLAYWTAYAPSVRSISVLHDGLLGLADRVVAAAILEELLAALERREAEIVLFRKLARGSALERAAAAAATFATRQHNERSEPRRLIEFPATFDEYLASLSSSTRKGVRRTARRLEREFAARLSIRRFRTPDDLAVFVRDAETVAVTTYQRRLGVGFTHDRRALARLRMLAEHGWFRGYVLYVDAEPIAFELGELYGGRFQSLAGAYDPTHGRHRVGAHLLIKAMEDLVADHAASLFDFGIGDADYKRKLAHVSVEETDVLLYARRPRTIRISLTRSALLGTSRAAEGVLKRLGLLDVLKRRATSASLSHDTARSTFAPHSVPRTAEPPAGARRLRRAGTSSRIRFALGLLDRDKDYYESDAGVLEYAAYDDLKKCEQPILDLVRFEGLADMRMLDLGVGGGRTTTHFAPHAREYHGIDRSPPLIDACRRRFAREDWPHVTWTVADARDLPYDDDFFDFVMFSWNGLDAVGDEIERLRALHEIRRILAPGGRFFFSAHNLENALARWRSRRALVRRLLNPHLLRCRSRDAAMVLDEPLTRLRHYYIRPAAQLEQLRAAGFSEPVALLSDGTQVPEPRPGQFARSHWLYYLCRA